MSGEIKLGREQINNPEEIEGRTFQVPSIRRRNDEYQFSGLHLPHDWQQLVAGLGNDDPTRYSPLLDRLCEDKEYRWELLIDENTGLIVGIELENERQSSQVFLDTRFGTVSGVYRGKGIYDVHTALIYQNFLSRYLSQMCDYKQEYAFIEKTDSGYYSRDLIFPRTLSESEKPLTNEHYQQRFLYKAHYIAGQFGTTFNHLHFNNLGILDYVQIDQDDCNYSLGSLNYYGSHNVDYADQAATLHGIVAEFINDLL